jgi:peroxiredoxin
VILHLRNVKGQVPSGAPVLARSKTIGMASSGHVVMIARVCPKTIIEYTGIQGRSARESLRKCLLIGFVAGWLSMPAENGTAWAAETDAGPAVALVGVQDITKPLFELPSLDGPSRDLAQYRDRVVLVHFFATWCEPCRPEMGRLQDLRARLDGEPFEIVAVSVAEADSAVRRFFANMPSPFPVLLDRDRAIAKAWSIHTLPTTVILDHRLQPRFVAEGDVDWARADVKVDLALLLKEVPAPPRGGGG